MDEETQIRHRRSIRLKNFDYTQPASYFVTISAHNQKCLFGEIIFGVMKYSLVGRLVNECWLEIPRHFPNVALPRHMIMPNHLHGIIVLRGRMPGVDERRKPAKVEGFSKPVVGSIGTIVRSFKSAVSKRAREMSGRPQMQVWQRNYYEHVIRNKDDFRKTVEYICRNPERWGKDKHS